MHPLYEVLIVGAGPAGVAAALNARNRGLRYLLLEMEDHIADTVYCYQQGKLVMAEPSAIPLRGELWLEPSLREIVLERWEDTVRRLNLDLLLSCPVSQIRRVDGCFEVAAGSETFAADKVILAIGSQGNRRKLGVPGEDLPHVLARLVDPRMYTDQDIVVVGGGDSAIEVAAALAPRNRVTMAVRTPEFIRAKDSLERCALELAERGQLTIHFKSTVERIEPTAVTLKLPASTLSVGAQVVIVKIGTLPPQAFLEACGIVFPSPDPAAIPLLSPTYETNVPGLFLVGAASGRGDLIKHAVNQGHEVIEHICGRDVEPVDEAPLRERLSFLQGTVSERIRQLLPKVPLLAGATEPQIRELLFSSRFHRAGPGTIIFRQHDYSESLYLVLEGRLEVLSKPDNGPERPVATMGAGEFFGEMSLISGRRRSATIRALSEAFLWEVGRKAMLKFIHTTLAAKDLVDGAFLIHAFQAYAFSKVDYAVLARLAERARVLTFERGQSIIREGEKGESFFFLRSGMVKVFKIRDGREIVVAYLSAGQYFGEMALLTGKPRVASVAAIDRVEVIQLAREDFLACVDGSPELKERFEQEADRRRLRNIEVEVRPELAELERFMISEEVVVGENVLLIDENRCIHCDQCVRACESVHDDGQTRIKRTGIKFANVLVANSCRHCENPLCMTDCPPGDAIVRDPRGEVYIRDNCIGCGNCAANCPYDNIFMVRAQKRWSAWDWLKKGLGVREPERDRLERSIPVKCDLCRDLMGGPACVRGCLTGAVLRLTPTEYNRKIETLVMERKETI